MFGEEPLTIIKMREREVLIMFKEVYIEKA
jgi:hypothetical protein